MANSPDTVRVIQDRDWLQEAVRATADVLPAPGPKKLPSAAPTRDSGESIDPS